MSVFQDVALWVRAPQQAEQATPSRFDLCLLVSRLVSVLEGRPVRHGLRVALLAAKLAEAMGCSKADQQRVAFAGLLHDVGLLQQAPQLAEAISSPWTVTSLLYAHPLLNAQLGPLSAQVSPVSSTVEALLTAHPMTAEPVVRLLLGDYTAAIDPLLTQAHELWNGQGYPHQLPQYRVDALARILVFADSIECFMQESNGLLPRLDSLRSLQAEGWLGCFCPEVCAAFEALALSEERFSTALTQLYAVNAEDQLRGYVHSDWQQPVGASSLITMTKAIGGWSDALLGLEPGEHSEAMVHWLTLLGNALDLPDEALGQLLLAGWLSGVGRFAVSPDVLQHDTTPAPGQWNSIRQVPELAEAILKTTPGFSQVSLWVSEQYERLNGSGYHCSKKSSEISLGGRLLGIVNAYVALTSCRAYRPHIYDQADALNLLEQGKDRLYDGKLVDLFSEIVHQHNPKPVSRLEKPILARVKD